MDNPTKQHFRPREVETRSRAKYPYASYKIRDPLEYAERVETERRHDPSVVTADEWMKAFEKTVKPERRKRR